MQRHNYPRHPDENIPQSFIQNNLGFEIPENKGSTGKDSVWTGSKPSCQLIILINISCYRLHRDRSFSTFGKCCERTKLVISKVIHC